MFYLQKCISKTYLSSLCLQHYNKKFINDNILENSDFPVPNDNSHELPGLTMARTANFMPNAIQQNLMTSLQPQATLQHLRVNYNNNSNIETVPFLSSLLHRQNFHIRQAILFDMLAQAKNNLFSSYWLFSPIEVKLQKIGFPSLLPVVDQPSTQFVQLFPPSLNQIILLHQQNFGQIFH